MPSDSKHDSWKIPLLDVSLLVLVVLMAAFVRYPNLEMNPGWYSDEGMLIDIAKHIDQGSTQYMALKGPLLMVGRPPLFINLLAFIFRFTGPGILPIRTLSATLGIISIVTLYGVIRGCMGREGIPLAFLAAAVMTLSPMAILYSRVAYSYSLLTPLVLLCILAAWKYLQTGKHLWLFMAALMVGVGSLTDLIMFTMLAPLVIVILAKRWKDVFIAVPIALSPFLFYIAMLLIAQPQETLSDLAYLFTRMKGFSLAAMIPAWIMNYGALLDHDSWLFPAIIGIFLIKPVRLRQILILFWALPVLLMARSIIIAGLGYYYVSPFLPMTALGIAAVAYYGIPRIKETVVWGFQAINRRLQPHIRESVAKRLESWNKVLSGLVIACIVCFPMIYYYLNAVFQLYTKFETSLDWILVDPVSGEKAIDYVNIRTGQEDLVIASPALAWALHARTADFQMPLVIDGIGTVHFPPGLDPSRFAYDTHLETARFVIMDPVWDNFGIKSIPEVADLAETIQEHWKLVFQDGDVRIYENPMDIQ